MTRILRHIYNSIEAFQLNLKGIVVLTEAATGYFAVTPAIALLAGAEEVICLTKDSPYGSAKEAIRQTQNLIHTAGFRQEPEYYTDLSVCPVHKADVVTNLGFVRPLDRSFIERMKKKAVISLMWEPWELRRSELDLTACLSNRIMVVGTNEQDYRLQTLRALGLTVMKMMFHLDLEILGNRYVIVHDCPFGDSVGKVLQCNGAEVQYVDLDTWLHPNTSLCDLFLNIDAVIFLVHCSDEPLFNPGKGPVPELILKRSPDMKVIHISGNVDVSYLETKSIPYFPETFAPPFHMSVNTSFIGPKPVIDLHTAGLHAGAVCFRLFQKGEDPSEVIRQARATAPVLEVLV